MLNIEKYKEEILKEYNNKLENLDEGRYSEQLANAIFDVFCCDKYKREKENVAEWAFREYEEPKLSDEAKAYLKTIIKPVECVAIHKISDYNVGTYKLYFFIKDGSITIKFKTDTKLYEYFKDMELNKSYTLKELDL